MLLNSLHVCPFIITKILQTSQFEHSTFSQMTFRELARLNSTDPYFVLMSYYTHSVPGYNRAASRGNVSHTFEKKTHKVMS